MRSLLRKINFALGRDPIVPHINAMSIRQRYIPSTYKAVLLINADFELAWAWRYAKGINDPRELAISRARRARINIPRILDICNAYNIPITWATVGHLFLDNCRRRGSFPHINIGRIPYHENEYWLYDRGDWFDDDPCNNWQISPEWYAPDLIEMILSSNVKHEIACHTFSHVNCSDQLCSAEILTEEINACQSVADKYGVKLRSFVHPGNIIGNLDRLRDLGFTSFRTDYGNRLDYPRKHKNGLWEIKSTIEFAYRREWSFEYHLFRYKKIVMRALKHNRVCFYWFHPSVATTFVDSVIRPLFEFIDSLRQDICVITVKDYVCWLNGAVNV